MEIFDVLSQLQLWGRGAGGGGGGGGRGEPVIQHQVPTTTNMECPFSLKWSLVKQQWNQSTINVLWS